MASSTVATESLSPTLGRFVATSILLFTSYNTSVLAQSDALVAFATTVSVGCGIALVVQALGLVVRGLTMAGE